MSNFFEENFSGNAGIGFMDDAEKHDLTELFDESHVIADYGFIEGEDGPFAVFCVKDMPGCFFFASSCITADLKKIEDAGEHKNIAKQKWDFFSKESKKGRTYTAMKWAGRA